MKNLFYFVLLTALFSCARVGSPQGGPRDTTPPRPVSSTPESLAVNVPVDLKELRIYFDEYVVLKDPGRQLIISPPLQRIKKIIPSSLANKYVEIQWEDTLQANTTYNFNFGNAIADNNEGNVLPYYNFVFSTGPTIDSLYISGTVTDALLPAAGDQTTSDKKSVVVGLYKDEDFGKKPYYIAVADPDGYFELNYLAAGKYNLLAFEDENKNSVYDPGKEKVAFLDEPIDLTQKLSGLALKLSPAVAPVKFGEVKSIPGGLALTFSGKPDSVTVQIAGGALSDYRVVHTPKSDSALVYINADQAAATGTALKFDYNADGKAGTASSFYRPNAKDELSLTNQGGNLLAPGLPFTVTSNMALRSLDTAQWKLTADSATVANFTAKIDDENPFKIRINAEYKPGAKYSLLVPRNTVQAWYFGNPRPLQFNFEADKPENYGSFVLRLQQPPSHPFWVQLLGAQNQVAYQQRVTAAEVKFANLRPGNYHVRLLVDEDENGVWDSADFASRRQAEPAYLFPKQITVRALWEIVEKWDLQENTAVSDIGQDPNVPDNEQ
ncbi:MAG: hypothetical protein EAS48_04780 [Chryseobacterium sp.]|nr:MAG: hypothetical protein EAS48_04780 [Chryseobacterium sp.]